MTRHSSDSINKIKCIGQYIERIVKLNFVIVVFAIEVDYVEISQKYQPSLMHFRSCSYNIKEIEKLPKRREQNWDALPKIKHQVKNTLKTPKMVQIFYSYVVYLKVLKHNFKWNLLSVNVTNLSCIITTFCCDK